MSKRQLKVIKNGSRLVAYGNLFKEHNSPGWQLSVYCQDKTFKPGVLCDSYVAEVDLLPFFAIGRIFSTKDKIKIESTGYAGSIELPSVNTWQKQKMGENSFYSDFLKNNYPELKYQKCFKFDVNGMQVILPVLELARVLFFHAAYLSRAAFLPNGLDTLLRVIDNNGEIKIEALPGSSIPIAHFENLAYRQHLTWILLNKNVRKSFDSIYAHMIKKSTQYRYNSRGTFDFEPPDLKGCLLNIRGKFDKNKNELAIFEILSISNMPHKIKSEVIFLHPDSKEYISNQNKPSKLRRFSSNTDPDQIELNLVDSPSCDTSCRGINAETLQIGYVSEIKTKRIYAKTRTEFHGREDETAESEKIVQQASLAESMVSGSIACAEINQLELEEIQSARAKKFTTIIQILEDLSKLNDGIKFEYTISPMPITNKCKFHLNLDGSTRYYLHAIFNFNRKFKHLLEIETSDGARSISTKVIEFKENAGVGGSVILIMGQTVRKSLVWDKKEFKKHCLNVKSVNHSGGEDNSSIDSWKGRLKIAIGIVGKSESEQERSNPTLQ